MLLSSDMNSFKWLFSPLVLVAQRITCVQALCFFFYDERLCRGEGAWSQVTQRRAHPPGVLEVMGWIPVWDDIEHYIFSQTTTCLQGMIFFATQLKPTSARLGPLYTMLLVSRETVVLRRRGSAVLHLHTKHSRRFWRLTKLSLYSSISVFITVYKRRQKLKRLETGSVYNIKLCALWPGFRCLQQSD